MEENLPTLVDKLIFKFSNHMKMLDYAIQKLANLEVNVDGIGKSLDTKINLEMLNNEVS